MKVLFANKYFYRRGGSETVLFGERDFLLNTGVEIVDFSMKDPRNIPSDYEDYFISARDYQTGSLMQAGAYVSMVHSFEATKRFARLLDETKPDIVHCHNIYHQLTPSIIGVAKARGIPVVLTAHDSKPVCPTYLQLCNGEPCSLCLDGDFRNVLRRRCAGGSLAKSALLYTEAVVQRWMGNYEKVDRFLAPSEFMRTSLAHRFKREKITLLRNGVDVGAYEPSDSDENYVLYFGRLSGEKGVETLLRAHAAADYRWRLVIAGTGPSSERYRKMDSHAEFLGHVSGDALRKTCRNASVVVVPSEWYENAPMSILEAMAYAKPVIGTHYGGIPELVRHGKTGLLFEPRNVAELAGAIKTLMEDPSLRRKMGAAGRQAVADLSADRHNHALLAIYDSLVDGCSRKNSVSA